MLWLAEADSRVGSAKYGAISPKPRGIAAASAASSATIFYFGRSPEAW